ncbi:MAG: hypothetical protein SP4CHLAM5_02350 [Chlamydiia bacterium]|nr:hypothetical protein [Chlamydiia bacterium]MCH9618109.1 hypothetical protein [Chlamydiia bacterium]MCH9623989.1 hypothetical protein [Chlamydiia bacterium]
MLQSVSNQNTCTTMIVYSPPVPPKDYSVVPPEIRAWFLSHPTEMDAWIQCKTTTDKDLKTVDWALGTIIRIHPSGYSQFQGVSKSIKMATQKQMEFMQVLIKIRQFISENFPELPPLERALRQYASLRSDTPPLLDSRLPQLSSDLKEALIAASFDDSSSAIAEEASAPQNRA